MAVHVRLKNEFMEDKKYHNLMRWLICVFQHILMAVISMVSVTDTGEEKSSSHVAVTKVCFDTLC